MSQQDHVLALKNIEMIPTDDIVLWDRNPRHNDHVVDDLANSIKAYGMNVPLVVNENNEVIAGNTRLKACVKLGLTEVPCVRANHLSPEQQKAFNIADNKLSELAHWDDDTLKEILEELSAEQDFEPLLLGYKQEDVDALIQGWSSDHQAMADIEPTDEAAPGKITIYCPAELKPEVVAALTRFLEAEGLHGVTIK